MTTILEYIWLDAENHFRSKVRIMNKVINNISEVPDWNYDGSSTGQATTDNSEIFLNPIFMCVDPFRKTHNSLLVWCEMLDLQGKPLNNSNRKKAQDIFNKFREEEPWFGIEQEYFIIDPKTKLPLGFSHGSIPSNQGTFYCGVGADRALGRQIVEEHMELCLYSNLAICGTNGEVVPGQWEYQIGPCVGINAGDNLWLSRYILNKVAEKYGYTICYEPKPLKEWNGSGLHTNFSTQSMREGNGILKIEQAINRLSNRHMEHMKIYGPNNQDRMTGKHETASYYTFSSGRGNRNVSVRIPNQVIKNGYGYFEDRRPAANADPYLVTSAILETIMDPSNDMNFNSRELNHYGC